MKACQWYGLAVAMKFIQSVHRWNKNQATTNSMDEADQNWHALLN